jgi:phage/plasmid-like protein (TIGR03299 family)
MAHEISSTDGLVLHKTRAWHGLGTIVQEAPTPAEALKLAGMDWEVQQWALSATDGEGQKMAIGDWVANVRTDTKKMLGLVGKGWKPFQNQELADFCSALQDQGQVKVETAGSIRGGQKVWFLLRGESFGVRGKTDDEIFPYICVSNGFDGGTSLRCTPTTVRVVCSNTLHMVIPKMEREGRRVRYEASCYCCSHVGNLKDRVEEAKKSLNSYTERLRDNRMMIDRLAVKDMNSEAVQRFLLEAFATCYGPVAASPKTEAESRHRERAMECVVKCVRRFEAEQKIAGTTAWNAFNSFTGWMQHDRPVRLRDEAKAREQRVGSTLFGDNSVYAVKAFSIAMNAT